MDRDLERMFDSQKATDPRQFIRILGTNPLQGEIRTKATFHVPESEVAEAFGPPQIVENEILFWNFSTRDGKTSFSLFTKQGRKKIDLVADGNFLPAYLWASDRLVSIGSGDEPPLTLSRAC